MHSRNHRHRARLIVAALFGVVLFDRGPAWGPGTGGHSKQFFVVDLPDLSRRPDLAVLFPANPGPGNPVPRLRDGGQLLLNLPNLQSLRGRCLQRSRRWCLLPPDRETNRNWVWGRRFSCP